MDEIANITSKPKYSWYHVISTLWLLIVARQWILYTEPVWFQETTDLVWFTLLVVAIIGVLLPLYSVISWIVKIIAVIAIHYYVLQEYGLFEKQGISFLDDMGSLFDSFFPYVWFALAAWLLFEMILSLVQWRGMILFVVGSNIVTFAILDSFTSYDLWAEVAWTFFAGMGWLVSHHFRGFQLKFPRGWKVLRHQPMKIVFNVTAVFACVLLVGVSMPAVSPTLTDPYSAWKNWTQGPGDTTKSPADGRKGSGTGSGSSSNAPGSGYSRDDSELGGGFEYNYDPVMTVVSNVRTYWRGETREVYSGQGWENQREAKNRKGYEHFEPTAPGAILDQTPKGIKTKPLELTIKMLNDKEYPAMFGAYSIESMNIAGEPDGSMFFLWSSRSSELLYIPTESGNYPKEYKITSQLPIIPLEDIRKQSYDKLYRNNLEEEYLQIPSEFPDRVRELATQITESATTPYAQMELLQGYLRSNFKYTNSPDLSQKESADFVEGFLFEIKEGYCDYYSTSMVMMARSLGVPARWVKGYAPGTSNTDALDDILSNRQPREQAAGSNKTFVVTNADAHSWAELYFGEEYGWIPFEATPGFDVPMMTQQEEDPKKAPVEEDEVKQKEPTDKTTSGGKSFGIPKGITVAAVVFLLVWFSYMLWKYRSMIYFGVAQMRQGRPLTSDEKVIVQNKRWLRMLRKYSYSREEHETIREAMVRWNIEDPRLARTVNDLLVQFETAMYSPQDIPEQGWKTTQTLIGILRTRLKEATK